MENIFEGDCEQVLLIVRIGVPHDLPEDIGFLVDGVTFPCFKADIGIGEILDGIHVSIVFVVKAALEFSALAGQFLGVERKLLHPRRIGRYRAEFAEPGGAAKFPAAGAEPAEAAGFLPCADLAHLDPDFEFVGKHLDKFAKIDPVLSSIIKNSFGVIALVFNVVDLHLKPELIGNLPRPEHGGCFHFHG